MNNSKLNFHDFKLNRPIIELLNCVWNEELALNENSNELTNTFTNSFTTWKKNSLEYVDKMLRESFNSTPSYETIMRQIVIELQENGKGYVNLHELEKSMSSSLKKGDSNTSVLAMLYYLKNSNSNSNLKNFKLNLNLNKNSYIDKGLLDSKEKNPINSDPLNKNNIINRIPDSKVESIMVRECLNAIQGLGGKYLKRLNKEFKLVSDGSSFLDGLTIPKRELINRICILGNVYDNIKGFVEETFVNKNVCLVKQALGSAINEQLNEYFRMVSVLSSQISSSEFTLRQLYLWTMQPLHRLSIISMIVEHCRNKKGGELLSALHSCTQHGDEVLHLLVEQLLEKACVPFFFMIRKWMGIGQLEDPFKEFFIQEKDNVSNADFWSAKFVLRTQMIPSIFSLEFVQDVLRIGKSLNFLKTVCNDSKWRNDEIHSKISSLSLSYQNLKQVKSIVSECSKSINEYLLNLMLETYHINDHLVALKNFMFLGQGDFIAQLLYLLKPVLKSYASNLFKHNLSGLLDQAIRSSLAQYNTDDVLERLDVRLLRSSEGDLGWDVFCLDYHIGSPLNTIFTKEAVESYLRVFMFLWKIKQVESRISSVWKEHVLWARMVKKSQFVDADLLKDIKVANLLRNELLLFLDAWQYYVMFEVLDSSWDGFLKAFQASSDLDEMIAAHSLYLDKILKRSLLDDDSEIIHKHIMKILALINNFWVHTERVRKNWIQQLAKNSKFASKYSSEDLNDKVSFKQCQISKKKIYEMVEEYHSLYDVFVGMLASRSRSNAGLRFLLTRLDFSGYYQGKNSKAINSDNSDILDEHMSRIEDQINIISSV